MIFLPSVRQMPQEHTRSDASFLQNRSDSATAAEAPLVTTCNVFTWEVWLFFALLVLTPMLCFTSLAVGAWSGLDAAQLIMLILAVLAACGMVFAVVMVRYLYRFRSQDMGS